MNKGKFAELEETLKDFGLKVLGRAAAPGMLAGDAYEGVHWLKDRKLDENERVENSCNRRGTKRKIRLAATVALMSGVAMGYNADKVSEQDIVVNDNHTVHETVYMDRPTWGLGVDDQETAQAYGFLLPTIGLVDLALHPKEELVKEYEHNITIYDVSFPQTISFSRDGETIEQKMYDIEVSSVDCEVSSDEKEKAYASLSRISGKGLLIDGAKFNYNSAEHKHVDIKGFNKSVAHLCEQIALDYHANKK